MHKVYCWFFFLTTICAVHSQNHELFLRSGNIGAVLPFTGVPKLFSDIYRPHTEVGYAVTLRQRSTHAWWLEARLGYFNHRFVQQVVPLMLETKYERLLGRFSVYGGLGLGYLLAFPYKGRWELDSDGTYQPVSGLGRGQFGANLSLGGRHFFNDVWSVSAEYRAMLQMPFVKTYVPVLPYGIVQLGVHYQIL